MNIREHHVFVDRPKEAAGVIMCVWQACMTESEYQCFPVVCSKRPINAIKTPRLHTCSHALIHKCTFCACNVSKLWKSAEAQTRPHKVWQKETCGWHHLLTVQQISSHVQKYTSPICHQFQYQTCETTSDKWLRPFHCSQTIYAVHCNTHTHVHVHTCTYCYGNSWPQGCVEAES